MAATNGNGYYPSTWVFTDFETSGLITRQGPPNILELTMFAVSDYDMKAGEYPRVMNKLTLAFQPRVKKLSATVSQLTGLTDGNLSDQQPFDQDSAKLILNFLDRLEKPVCLLAHNGKNFDFPILWAEFADVNIPLPHDLLCADTLEAFRAVVPRGRIPTPPRKFQLTPSILPKRSSETQTHESEYKQSVQSIQMDDMEMEPQVKRRLVFSGVSCKIGVRESHSEPARLPQCHLPNVRGLDPSFDTNEITSDDKDLLEKVEITEALYNLKDMPIFCVNSTDRTADKAGTSSSTSSTLPGAHSSVFITPPKEQHHECVTEMSFYSQTYKLQDIYQSIFGPQTNSHRAEGDVEALLSVCHAHWSVLKEYFGNNNQLLCRLERQFAEQLRGFH